MSDRIPVTRTGYDKLRAELEQAQKKLGNESFVARAPAEVVDKARARVADAQSAIASLEARGSWTSGPTGCGSAPAPTAPRSSS